MYHCPTDLASALDLISHPGTKVVAGGTDVYPAAPPGWAPDALLDVTRIPDMTGIRETGDGWRIGAATTWRDLISAPLPPAFDALKQAAHQVGGVQIQNAGTLAGNLCNASPAADGVPPLLALDAQVELVTAAGQRQLDLGDFITGVRQIDLRPGELVTAITIPSQYSSATSGFEKLGSRRYLVISIAMTAVVIDWDDAGHIARARVAVGAASPVARRLHVLENDLRGVAPGDVTVTPDHLTGLSPIDDVRGTARYRERVVAEQICRAIRQAAAGRTQ